MTTAASAVLGRSASSELKNSSISATAAAPTSPATWLFAPDCSATAVRDPLVDTAKPWNNPAATFAVPRPIISWSGRTSSPRRAAKLVEVAIVSVRDTSVMPRAATNSSGTSPSRVQGRPGLGSPWGSAPTVETPCADRSRTAETTVTPMMATRIAGTFGVTRGRSSSSASTERPTASVTPCVWSRCEPKARSSSTKPLASVEKPKSLGSWPTMIVTPSPFM